MPITATHLLTSGDSADATSYVTASISPTAGKLVLLAVANVSTATPPANTPTVSGAGMTWTEVATKVETTDTFRRITVFRGVAGGSSGALTIDFAGETQLRCGWSISEFADCDTSGTNGANGIVQSVTGENVASPNTDLSITLAAFTSTDNATYGALRKASAEAVSPGTGFTELGEYEFETGNIIETEFKATNDTSVDWSWASGNSFATGIGIELRFRSGGVLDTTSKMW